MPRPCQPYLTATVNALCGLTAALSATEVRAVLATPAMQAAEQACNAAALAGDARRTKMACRRWWQVCQAATRNMHHAPQQEMPHE